MPWTDRLWRGAVVAVVLAVLVGLGAIVVRPRSGAPADDPAPPPEPALIATGTGRTVAVYRHQGDVHAWKTLHNPNAQGAPLVFLVQQRGPHWLKVLVPVRPNGSAGWLRAAQVRLTRTAYRMDVSLRTHRLVLRNGDRTVLSALVAVGRKGTPTPSGRFFVTSLLKPPDPHGAYGPYAFGLSAFSDVLFHFGGGPGQIGLHGTDRPSLLGKSVSHGCIRVSNRDVRALARVLPLGTPVTVHAAAAS
jgi:lipoprotein-anchoring transpeptidase ErfK/SrfK